MVKLNQSGNYLKPDDVKDGDLVTFKTEGEWIESRKYTYPDGNPRSDFVITVDYKGEERSLRVNKVSRDELIPAYGNDTTLWVGKQAKITIENYRSLNTKGIILLPFKQDKPVEDSGGVQTWDD